MKKDVYNIILKKNIKNWGTLRILKSSSVLWKKKKNKILPFEVTTVAAENMPLWYSRAVISSIINNI